MSDQNKRGRPLKRNGRKLIKFYADNDDAAYLDAVKAARGLPSVAEAGRLVLSDAHAQRRFLARQTTRPPTRLRRRVLHSQHEE